MILWLDGTTSKSLPHEVFSSMKDYDYHYDEEDEYWEGEDEPVPYVSLYIAGSSSDCGCSVVV